MYMYFLVPGKTIESSVAVMVSSYMYCGSTYSRGQKKLTLRFRCTERKDTKLKRN